jgi:5,10-methylenetetrahydromethanopterin reductase
MTAPDVSRPALEMPVGLSVGLASQPLATTVQLAEEAEEAGLDFVSVGDAGVDTFALLGAVAARTTRLRLTSGIAIWSRSPLTMATAAKTVHNLCDGRFLLGIGPMPRTWATEWHGLAYDPVVARMREYLTAVRACLDASASHPATVPGKYFPVTGYPGHPVTPERRVPVALAATLPAMTRLAAELTDAVMLNVIQPWEMVSGPGPGLIAEGLNRAGRRRADIEVGLMRFCAADEDRAVAYDRARRSIAFYFGIPYFRPLLEPYGFGAELDAGEAAVARGDREAAVAAVSDRLVDSVGVAGTPDEVLAKLARYQPYVDWIQVSCGLNLPGEVAGRQARRLAALLGAGRRAVGQKRRNPLHRAR